MPAKREQGAEGCISPASSAVGDMIWVTRMEL